MTSKRVFYVQLGLLCLLIILLIGGTYFANVILQKQAKKLLDLKTQVAVLNQQQTNLAKAKKDVTKYNTLNTIARTIVPQDKDQAEAVREIVNLANANGLSLSLITFPSSNLGVGVPTKTPASGSSSTTSGTSKPITPPLTQVTPVAGITGVYDLPITIQQDANKPVPFERLSSFLSALEHNRRTAQVSAVTITPDGKNPGLLTFTLTVDEYIKP
jgi:hypothetical protein